MAICQDDLFGLFLHLLSFFFCFCVTYLKMAVPGKMGLNYYICTGENPEPYSYLGGKFPVSAIISLFTLVTYTGVSFRLALEKREIRLQEQQQVFHLQQNGFFDKLFPHVSKYAWSTLDLKNLYVSIFSSEHYFKILYI